MIYNTYWNSYRTVQGVVYTQSAERSSRHCTVSCVRTLVSASSASSESVFSAVGNAITNKRNTLSAENAQKLVFLHGCHGVGWSLDKSDAVGELDKQAIISRPMKAQKYKYDSFEGIWLGPR